MTWTKSFEALMRAQGLEPYACLTPGCPHVSRSTFGMLIHWRWGTHDRKEQA